ACATCGSTRWALPTSATPGWFHRAEGRSSQTPSSTLRRVSTRVLELWDQRPIRLAVSALAAVVLAIGLVAFVRSREAKPVQYAATPPAPSAQQQATATYGPKIPVPAEATRVTRQLVEDGVLRKHPLAARKLVSAQLSAAATDQQWAEGTLPMP